MRLRRRGIRVLVAALARVGRATVVSIAGLALLVVAVLSAWIVRDPFVSAVQLVVTVALLGVTARYVRLTDALVTSARDQVRATENALRVTDERASRERSLEYCKDFVNEVVPAHWRFRDELAAMKMTVSYRGAVGDFTPSSLSEVDAKAGRGRAGLRSGVTMLNRLEVFATAIVYGVADAEIAFAVNGRVYCGYVASNYDCIVLARSAAEPETWQTVVDLYRLWRPRLSENDLTGARASVENEQRGTSPGSAGEGGQA